MEGYALINQYNDSLKDWEALSRQEQILLRAAWLGEEVRSNFLYGAIGAGLGALFHEAAKAGNLIPKKYSGGTLISSAVIGGIGLYFVAPMIERIGIARQFDELYPLKAD